jgi:hypothetical protein
MPVNPTTNETQLTLIQEFDLKVGKSLVGALPLRVSDDWVSNGVWAVKRRRVSNQTIFTCQCCLHRDTGQHFLTPFEDYAVEALFPVDAVMERWVKTEHIIETAGVDYVRYLSDAGQVMYLRRDYAESLGLTYVYGDTPERGVWDARDLDDMSIVIPGHREPQNIRLQLAELLEASTVSDHVEPAPPREEWVDPFGPADENPFPNGLPIVDVSLSQSEQPDPEPIPETTPTPTRRNRRAAPSYRELMIGQLSPQAMREFAPQAIRTNGWFDLPSEHAVYIEGNPVALTSSSARFLEIPITPGVSINSERVLSVEIEIGPRIPAAMDQPAVITGIRIRLTGNQSFTAIIEPDGNFNSATLRPYSWRTAGDVEDDEVLPLASDTERANQDDMPFARPVIPDQCDPIELSDTLFEKLRESAERANMSDPTTWKVHRVNNVRLVPLALDDARGIVLCLRATSENNARIIGGEIRPVQSGGSTMWVSSNAGASLFTCDADAIATRDWTINVDGTDYRATFIPNWTDSTHYVVVYTGGSQSSVRHIPLAELPANTNPAIQTLLERIVREVVTGQ